MNPTMQNLHYKFLLWLLLISMILSSCAQPTAVKTPDAGATTPKPQTPGIDTPKPQTPDSTKPEPINDQGGTGSEDEHATITFTSDEYLRSTYEPLIEEFNKLHPDITVQFASLPQWTEDKQDLFNNYMRLLAVSGDTALAWTAGTPGAEKYFLDLLPLMEGDPNFDSNDFWNGSLEACQDFEGRSLGLPVSIQISGIYYNDEAFNEAGVPLPRPGWKLSDFRKAATALAGVVEGKNRYGYYDQGYNGLLIPLLDDALITSDGDMEAENVKEVVQWYLDLVKVKAILPQPYAEDEAGWNKIWQEQQELFTSPHRPAMWVGQLGDALPGTQWIDDQNDPFANSAIKHDGFAPYPISDDGSMDKTSIAWTQCLVVSAGTRNPRAAWTWLDYLSRQWLNKGKTNAWDLMQIPARRSTIAANDYWKLIPEKAVPALQFALDHAWYSPGFYPMETGFITSALSKVAAGKADYASEIAQIKAQITPTPEPTPDNELIVVATPQPTLSPDAQVVNYFSNSWGPELEAIRALILEYNKDHPDVAIKLTSEIQTQEDWYTAITEKFDCFTWFNGELSVQGPGNLLSLDSLVESEGKDFIKEFYPQMLDTFRVEGKLYAIPASADPMMLAYNKDLLVKRGLKPPSNDWTFDDFIRMIAASGGGSGDEKTYGFIFEEWDDMLLLGKGARYVDLESDPIVPLLNSPEMVSFVNWLLDMKTSGGLFFQTNDNWEEMDRIVREGRVAFFRTNASQPKGWYFYDQEPPFTINLAPLPKFEDYGMYSTISSVRGHFITRSSQNVQGCWDWIKYISEQPSLFQGIPARASALESAAWEATVGKESADAMRAMLENLDVQTTPMEYNPISWPLSVFRTDAIRKALSGENSSKEMLDNAQKLAEVYLECMAGVDYKPYVEKEKYQELDEKIQNCARQADPTNPSWQPVQ